MPNLDAGRPSVVCVRVSAHNRSPANVAPSNECGGPMVGGWIAEHGVSGKKGRRDNW